MKLTENEKRSLRDFAEANGRTWKSKLRGLWERGACSPTLQQLRNRIGPSGLAKLRPADLKPTDLAPTAAEFAELMAQRDAVKAEYPGVLCLYAIGDFYEAYRDDARKLATVCELTLTSRRDVPMAGIPCHILDASLAKLVAAGVRVALCEQVESAAGQAIERKVLPGSLTS